MNNKLVIVIIAAIILAVGVLIFINLSKEEVQVTEPASNNTFGSGEGLVLMEAYSLGCPACAEYHPILKEIRQEYGDRITFQAVHFPLTVNFGNARAAHRAVEAAAKQGKFWEMHDILFERRDLWSAQYTDQPIPQLEVFAEEIGLDLEQFRQDFQSSEINDIINQDEDYLKELGVSSTPTFFIDGKRIASTRLNSVDTARQTLNEFLGIETEETTEEPVDNTDEQETGETQPEENSQLDDAGAAGTEN